MIANSKIKHRTSLRGITETLEWLIVIDKKRFWSFPNNTATVYYCIKYYIINVGELISPSELLVRRCATAQEVSLKVFKVKLCTIRLLLAWLQWALCELRTNSHWSLYSRILLINSSYCLVWVSSCSISCMSSSVWAKRRSRHFCAASLLRIRLSLRLSSRWGGNCNR